MNETILQQIKQLPPLPESAIQIEAVYQNPDASFKDMVVILEKDPLLTADILKAANSPLYGFSREITSISQAVSLFGMGTIRGFALASIVKKSFKLNLSPYNIDENQFSTLSKEMSALATNWYIRKDAKLLAELSPATFLIEIGKVVIAQALIIEGKDAAFKEKIAACENPLDQSEIGAVEIEFMGADTTQVSAAIFNKWKFDEKFVSYLEHATQPKKAEDDLQKVSMSLQVVRTAILADGTMDDASIERAKALVNEYKLDMESFEKAITTMKEA